MSTTTPPASGEPERDPSPSEPEAVPAPGPGPVADDDGAPTAPQVTPPPPPPGPVPPPPGSPPPVAPPPPPRDSDAGTTGGQHAAERPRPPSAPPAVPLPPTAPPVPEDAADAGRAAPGADGPGADGPAPLTGSPADRRTIADRTVVNEPSGGPGFSRGGGTSDTPPTGAPGDTAVGPPPGAAPAGPASSPTPGTAANPTTPGTTPPGTTTTQPGVPPPSRRPLPEPPRKPGFGRHLLGVLVGLVVTPVALVLTGLGAARIAEVVGGTESTDALAIVFLALGAALLAVVVLLGAWSPAVPITGGALWGIGVGVTYLAIPRAMDDAVGPTLADQITPEALSQLTWFAASGVLLVTGVLLVAAGMAIGFARRAGRRWAELVAAADSARARATGPA